MKPSKKTTFLSILLLSASLILLQLKPVQAFETPSGLEGEYQQIISQYNDALLPASIPFTFNSAEVNVLDSYYSLTLDINQFQNVLISARYETNPSNTIDALQSLNYEQISLRNQVIGYFSPPGETDEEAPQLTFFVGTTEFFLSGWVNPDHLITLANSMIENQ